MPIQIAQAETETFTILTDGMREETGDFNQLRELADFISFGLCEAILEHNENRVVVFSSMGKQSTGKSYVLNHLSGSCFDTLGGRCTDGVWMTVHEFPQVTYVLLDSEGLGSFERSAQDDPCDFLQPISQALRADLAGQAMRYVLGRISLTGNSSAGSALHCFWVAQATTAEFEKLSTKEPLAGRPFCDTLEARW